MPHKDLQQIIEICHILHRKDMLAAADGNVSIRLDSERITITPSGKNKQFLNVRDLAIVGIRGDVISGYPSSELDMHLAVYRTISEAAYVIHAHPPTAIAWTIARPDLTHIPVESLSETILGLGEIPIVPYQRPGTRDMGDAIVPFVKKHRAMILARHGAISWGESMMEALNGMERIEHSCKILKSAHELGGITNLDPQEIMHLRAMRTHLGPVSR